MSPRPPASTLGIDLASQAANTAACLLVWHEDRAEVAYLERGRDARGPLDDERLLELMLGEAQPHSQAQVEPEARRPRVRIGIDAPLGWPVAFVRAVADVDAWPLADEVAPVELVRRRCDRWIHGQTGKLPLSVSSDRIAYPAMRAARLLRRYRQATGVAVDRTGMTGPVSEVYPDTAITRLGLRPAAQPRLSYKGDAGRPAREQILAALAGSAPWLELSEAQRRACVDTDDHLDALIAALLTRAVQLGLTYPPPPEMAAEAAREGWIHLPHPDCLAQLEPPRA